VHHVAGVPESWRVPLTEWSRRKGIPPPVAHLTARSGVAVARGLLLDLLATGDHEGTEAAMEQFVAMHQAAMKEYS